MILKTGMKVLDAMTTSPVVVKKHMNLQQCAEIMEKYHVGSVLVMDGLDLQGIISESDIVHKAVRKNFDSTKTKVGEIMTVDMVTITSDKDMYEAVKKMRDLNVKRLPVLDHDMRCIGILTLNDVLRVQPEFFQLVVDMLDLREEHRKPVFSVSENEGICQKCGEYAYFLFDVEGSKVCRNCK